MYRHGVPAATRGETLIRSTTTAARESQAGQGRSSIDEASVRVKYVSEAIERGRRDAPAIAGGESDG